MQGVRSDLSRRRPENFKATIGMCGFVLVSCLVGCAPFELAEPTPLTRAIAAQDRTLVKRLLDEGADPNKGELALPIELAAEGEDVEILELLLDRGAELHVDRDDKWSALFYAARSGTPEAVRLLVDRAGADPCTRTTLSSFKGLRASEVAQQRGNERVVATLTEIEQARCSQ